MSRRRSDTAVESAPVVAGDPASCSALGSELRRQAERLNERRMTLRREASQLRGWSGPAAEAFQRRVRAQLAAVEQIAGRLDETGAALQAYATDLAHAQDQGEMAEQQAADQEMVIDLRGVVSPAPGPTSVEAARRRLAAVPLAQHHVDSAQAEARAAADRLRRRTSAAVQALRQDAWRLAALDHGTASTSTP